MILRLLAPAVAAVALLPAFATAQKSPKPPAPIAPPLAKKAGEAEPPDARRPREFANTELPVVLRLLARQARVNLVIADEVLSETSTVTMRLEDVTALEAIKAITDSKGLRLEKKGDIYHVDVSPERRAELAAEKKKPVAADEMQAFIDRLSSALFGERGLFGEPMTRALTAQAERLLDWESDPANAARIAKSRKALLDSLLKEGFSREEAMRILERHQMRWALPGLDSK